MPVATAIATPVQPANAALATPAPAEDSLLPVYARLPVRFSRGAGAWLYDATGRAWLDAISGIAVCGLGHTHPAVTSAVRAQAATLLHCSNLYQIEAQEALSERLTAVAGMERAFFCNSGTEANEAAIKLARRHGVRRGFRQPRIIVMENAFHGRSMATLSASGQRRIQAGFGALVEGFARAPFGDLEAVRRIAATCPEVVAVLVEPVQGEGGVLVAPTGYLRGLRELCDEHQWLLMLDEVQSGNARTGHWYACQAEAVQPDVLSTAKGLGNGVPIGACLVAGAATELLAAGDHGSTFGGNPLACAAALAVVDTIEREGLCARALALGTQLREALRSELSDVPEVLEVRGSGLMIGVQMERPCGGLVTQALAAGLLVNVTAERVLRLLPPLILSDEEGGQLAERVAALVRTHLGQRPGGAG